MHEADALQLGTRQMALAVGWAWKVSLKLEAGIVAQTAFRQHRNQDAYRAAQKQ